MNIVHTKMPGLGSRGGLNPITFAVLLATAVPLGGLQGVSATVARAYSASRPADVAADLVCEWNVPLPRCQAVCVCAAPGTARGANAANVIVLAFMMSRMRPVDLKIRPVMMLGCYKPLLLQCNVPPSTV